MAARLPGQPAWRSLEDHLLQPAFVIFSVVSSYTIARLWGAVFVFLPAYVAAVTLPAIPHIIKNISLLLTASRREFLIQRSDGYRRSEEQRAKQQLEGTFHFQSSELHQPDVQAICKEAGWFPQTEDFEVCGARVSVVHELPPGTVKRSGQTVVLLHGNPSWSFMWRNIIPALTGAGYEVFALDWIGHGLSDKPYAPPDISFELHMRTLLALFDRFALRDAAIVAHDWGGCIASACGPLLPPAASRRLLLLNSFMPPRPLDTGLNCYSLYVVWFLMTGVLGKYVPEWAVMRFMYPLITADVVRGYAAPFVVEGLKVKASVGRFAHIVPGFPDWFLFGVRESPPWRLLEGLCGPPRFTNMNAQAALAGRNRSVRRFWGGCSKEGWRVSVVFGNDDPLLRDFKDVLEAILDTKALVAGRRGGWIPHAGHYPVEDRPDAVVEAIEMFFEQTTSRAPE